MARRGRNNATLRIDEALWATFGEVAQAAGANRSDLLRDFVEWFVRRPNAKMPKRPALGNQSTDADQGLPRGPWPA